MFWLLRQIIFDKDRSLKHQTARVKHASTDNSWI